MKISKVINNNVLSAFDENGQEVVLMGRGLGFKAKTGDDIDESRVQKVFCIENSALSRQFQEMISNIPMEHMQISADIISYAKNECGMELNQSIYVALTDHINFAIDDTGMGLRCRTLFCGRYGSSTAGSISSESMRSAFLRRDWIFISRRMRRDLLHCIL